MLAMLAQRFRAWNARRLRHRKMLRLHRRYRYLSPEELKVVTHVYGLTRDEMHVVALGRRVR